MAHSEDELGRKWDRCLTDAVLKTGGGLALGVIFNLLFTRSRKWPIILGGGIGMGMAYANCERDINATLAGRQSGPCETKRKTMPVAAP